MTDCLILMYTRMKILLNKTINIGTNYLDFREGQDIEDEQSDILILYNLFLICLFVCVLI